MEATQLIWDFGATGTKIEKAKLRLAKSELSLFQTRQNVMFEVVRSAVQLRRTLGVLRYAKRSEDNVRRQTGLEESKVRSGGGYSTDVLQAKTQLVGAKTRRLHAERGKKQALISFRRYFPNMSPQSRSMDVLTSVLKELPSDVEDALAIAGRNNPKVQIALLDEQIATKTIKETKRDSYLPKLDLVGKAEYNNNVGGTAGEKQTASIKLQLSMPVNLGFTSVNKVSAFESDAEAASYKLADARLQVEEAVLNAWVKFETARASAALLRDQAALAKGFLELARQERTLGNRSLIDVLSGESAHFNALSDALSAEADVLLAAFEILKATGQLLPPEPSIIADIAQPRSKKAKRRVHRSAQKKSQKRDVWSNLR